MSNLVESKVRCFWIERVAVALGVLPPCCWLRSFPSRLACHLSARVFHIFRFLADVLLGLLIHDAGAGCLGRVPAGWCGYVAPMRV